MIDRDRQKMAVFVRLARDLASLSTCRRRRVGCVVVQPDFSEVLAIGYNGPPSGVDNGSCRFSEGSCGCCHAENNALVKLRTRDSGLTMVTTCSPCEACAGMVLNSGRVARIVYLEEYRDARGVELLRSAGREALLWPGS